MRTTAGLNTSENRGGNVQTYIQFTFLQFFKNRCIGKFQLVTTTPSDRGISTLSGRATRYWYQDTDPSG